MGVRLHYALLTAELDTCVARFVAREGTGERDEIVRTMHSQFVAHSMPRHGVEATGSVTEVAAAVQAAWRSGQLAVERTQDSAYEPRTRRG